MGMPLDLKEVEKPFKSLRKMLKGFPRRPSPTLVHDLRTRTRRVEAAVSALSLDQKRSGKRLLKAVSPLRKRAGKVRDMDVLTGFASKLAVESDNECLVQLLEHLGKRRFDGARTLHKAVVRKGTNAAQSLKRCTSAIEESFNGKKGRSAWPVDAAGTALQLSAELTDWPKLSANNLHPFRLKVKELRNVLRLSGKDGDLVDTLGEVKDAIGEWHDWTELGTIAAKILDHGQGCKVREQIQAEAKRRLEIAMALANRVREQYFTRPRSKRHARSQAFKEPVLEASATLAA